MIEQGVKGRGGLQPLAVPTGVPALALLPLLEQSLRGDRPVMPHAASGPVPPVPVHDPASLPDALAVVVGTSGSTGTPKRAMLTAPALRASARATHDTLGGPGQWLLAIPAHHIAGLQVLLRSLDAGTSPLAMDLTDGFRPQSFVTAAEGFTPGARRYTSLVPTQVVRLLDHPGGADALRTFDAVLVGGAAMPPRLRARAERARVHLVATYGMSETAGGCVYDGVALPRTEVELDEEGRILLGGPTIAHGYLGLPDLTRATFGTDEDGIRWFRTDDVGHVDDRGRLHVDGRLDDLINTGGLKVAPRLVEEAILEHVPGIRDVVVVGAPDREWGEAVCALFVLEPGALHDVTADDLRAYLRDLVPDHALPRRARRVTDLPTRGPGKPDRRAVAALFTMG
ncbi:o-succinylbenzoate--CoA ligase [Ornithinibacter aureus]|uniref:O-succinylbenzoate--CoA ligase n=1 Tax=Ornithinibacter aureus TaxID=622664 RepID=A0ABP8JDH1_9MICO|nr:o-succinylbenzoate--CoA ligase [Ornithinibacter aureus]KAF0833977.1 O-succinylbenzoic acid--CoA ligase [Ornithinibacter aureus]